MLDEIVVVSTPATRFVENGIGVAADTTQNNFFDPCLWMTMGACSASASQVLRAKRAPCCAQCRGRDRWTHVRTRTSVTPRRGFFTRIAAAAMALGLTGLASAPARAAAGAEDGPDWPGTLKGRHRQVVDAYAANDGFPLAFAFTFVVTNGPASAGVVPATAVVVLRHTAFPFALDHTMWQKYKIGQSLSILDPETKAPAVKNPFLQPKPGVLTVDDMRLTVCWRTAR